MLSQIPEFKLPDGSFPDARSYELSLHQIFFVAEEDDKILGLILGYKLTTEFVYFDLLAVSPDARGKKIGSQLMSAF